MFSPSMELPMSATPPRTEFVQRYLMARQALNPRDYGVEMDKDQFMDRMVEDFQSFGWQGSLDELLLRPRTALAFCDEVRRRHGWFDLPDDVMLRAIMTRRKGA
jgi:hypothetical protein